MDNFFTPSQAFQPEVDRTAELQALQRRQQLIEAMQMRARQTPIQAGSDKQAAFQALASLGQQFLMGKTKEKLAEQERATQEEVNRTQQQNLDAYIGAREGPGAKDALLRALTSRDPRLQKLGDMDSAKMQQAAGFKDHVIGGSLVRVPNAGGGPQVMGTYGKDAWSEPYTIPGASGPLTVIRNATTGEVKPVDRSPKVNVSTTVDNKGQLAAAEALGKKAPEVVAGAQERIIKAQSEIEDGKRLIEMLQSPDLISGFAAGPLAGLASFGAKLGITGPEAAAQTQAVMAALANNTLAQVKRLPGAITEKERPFLEMAASGKLDWTPEALQHLAGLSVAAAHNELMQSYKQYQSASSTPGLEQAQAMYPIPAIAHTLDEGMFADMGQGRVRYNKPLPGNAPAKPAVRNTSSGW